MEVSGQLHAPSKRATSTCVTEGWVGPRTSLNAVVNLFKVQCKFMVNLYSFKTLCEKQLQ